jgi:hypothetical protein
MKTAAIEPDLVAYVQDLQSQKRYIISDMISEKAVALASNLQISTKASSTWVRNFILNNSIILHDFSLNKEHLQSEAESIVPSATIETIEDEVAEEVAPISVERTIVDSSSSSCVSTEFDDTGNYFTSKLLSIATASTDYQQKGTSSIYTNIPYILCIYSFVIGRMITKELNENMGKLLIQRLIEYCNANNINNVDVDHDILNDVLAASIPPILSSTAQSYDEIIFSLIETYVTVQLEAKKMIDALEEIESQG